MTEVASKALDGKAVGRLPTWLRWRRMLPLTLLAMAVYYVATLISVRAADNDDQARSVDAIVVLGAAQYNGTPSPLLAGRLDHALTLYKNGTADVIVVTGGKQSGDVYTESEAERNYLLERGVPKTAILAENDGRNTYDSLRAVADILTDRGMGSVVLVTDPYHTLRTRMIAEEVGLEAYSSSVPNSVVTGFSEFRGELKEAAGVAVGRLIGFERLTSITG